MFLSKHITAIYQFTLFAFSHVTRRHINSIQNIFKIQACKFNKRPKQIAIKYQLKHQPSKQNKVSVCVVEDGQL